MDNNNLRVEVETEDHRKNGPVKSYGVIIAFTQGGVGGPKAIIKLDNFKCLVDKHLWDFKLIESDDNVSNDYTC